VDPLWHDAFDRLTVGGMEREVVAKKKVSRAKIAGGLLLMLGVPVTCTGAAISESVAWSGASFVAFVLGLVLFVIGRMKD
jgi:hypothetical protein